MLTDEVRDKLVRQILVALDECYREEIERLRLAINGHREQSIEMARQNPAIRLTEIDYDLWEALQHE